MTTLAPDPRTGSTVELVHPGIEESQRTVVDRTPALAGIEHARVGIVENGKWNAGNLLEAMRRAMVDGHAMSAGTTIGKQHYNRDLTGEELAAVQEGSDIALAAIGDCGSCTSYTIRDMVNLERIGIPTVAVVTEPFLPLAQSCASALGLPDGRIQAITHPLYGIDDDELASRVADSVDAVVAALTDGSP